MELIGTTADILIVDDTPANLRLLSETLEEKCYNVRKAINGNMALLSIKTSPPDLILLDVNMPDMNGYEVCKILKEQANTRQIPVIFMSALNETLDKVKAFQVGAVDYVTKPFILEEVLSRVHGQLELQQLREKLTLYEQKLAMMQEILAIHGITPPSSWWWEGRDLFECTIKDFCQVFDP